MPGEDGFGSQLPRAGDRCVKTFDLKPQEDPVSVGLVGWISDPCGVMARHETVQLKDQPVAPHQPLVLGSTVTATTAREVLVPGTISISLSVHLSTPTEEAFGYFANQARAVTWLPLANVSPTVGGPHEFFWDSEVREVDSTIGCRVTAVAVGRFLAFQWRSPKQFACFANAADPLTHVVVMFFPEHSGSRIDLLHTG